MTSSHPTLLGLLAACKADPDDDTPRLILADWLDENGEPERAEFIRLQIEAATLPEYDSRACDLDVRAEEILAQHETGWLGDWSERLVRWTFRRGFVDSVTIELGHFIQYQEALFRHFPVRKLRFVNTSGNVADIDVLLNVSEMFGIQHIRALDGSGNPDMCWLAMDYPINSELRELIRNEQGPPFANPLAFEELQLLCGSVNLKGLEALDIGTAHGTGLGDILVELLVESVFASNLCSLTLDGHHIGDTGAIQLATDQRSSNLERLRLAGCGEMTTEGMRALLDSPNLTQLRDLCLEEKEDAARFPLTVPLQQTTLAPMARGPRQAPGGFAYHVLNRAVARLPLFEKPADYDAFLRVMHEALAEHPMRIVAFVLMPNHWHLLLWPQGARDLTQFCRWLAHTHSMRWHAHYHTSGTGHIYQGRFKSFAVENDDRLDTVWRYIERNPLRANLVTRAEDWRWSSLWRRLHGV